MHEIIESYSRYASNRLEQYFGPGMPEDGGNYDNVLNKYLSENIPPPPALITFQKIEKYYVNRRPKHFGVLPQIIVCAAGLKNGENGVFRRLRLR